MKHMTKRWFTLVELIVVIAILAILSTIVFLKVKPYLWHSRNTVRMDSVSKINMKISSYMVSDRPVMVLTGTGREVQGASIWGMWATSAFYAAGVPRYNILDLQRKDYYDPRTQDDYLLGVTSHLWGKYHIALAFESDEGDYGRVEWDWSPRSDKTITWTGKVGSTKFKIANPGDINYFAVGDIITWVWISAIANVTVESIGNDGTFVVLSKPFSADNSGIWLKQSEVLWLVRSYYDQSVPVTNYGKEFPYPIK